MTMIRIADHPQLALICWNRDRGAQVEEAEAFALYERNWHLVDREAMGPGEKALLARLTADFGHGILNV
ncbi:hypothetical protein [Paracoccus sp. ME4]|uniref:hypothetical protein n=1 Tax=Paracoccus sp. ME4 TaxID=3138066 RepID=UPI00398AE36A